MRGGRLVVAGRGEAALGADSEEASHACTAGAEPVRAILDTCLECDFRPKLPSAGMRLPFVEFREARVLTFGLFGGADLLLQVRCAGYNGTLGFGFGRKFHLPDTDS